CCSASSPPLPSLPTRRSSDLCYCRGAATFSRGGSQAHPQAATKLRGLVLPSLTPGLLCSTPSFRALPAVAGRGADRWHPQDVERSEEHTSELQSRENLVCRLL